MTCVKEDETTITFKRLKELEDYEARFVALENAGVDNWDGYDDALAEYRKELQQEKRLEAMLDDLMSELGAHAYEPSERGAGVAFPESSIQKAMSVLKLYGAKCTKEID